MTFNPISASISKAGQNRLQIQLGRNRDIDAPSRESKKGVRVYTNPITKFVMGLLGKTIDITIGKTTHRVNRNSFIELVVRTTINSESTPIDKKIRKIAGAAFREIAQTAIATGTKQSKLGALFQAHIQSYIGSDKKGIEEVPLDQSGWNSIFLEEYKAVNSDDTTSLSSVGSSDSRTSTTSRNSSPMTPLGVFNEDYVLENNLSTVDAELLRKVAVNCSSTTFDKFVSQLPFLSDSIKEKMTDQLEAIVLLDTFFKEHPRDLCADQNLTALETKQRETNAELGALALKHFEAQLPSVQVLNKKFAKAEQLAKDTFSAKFSRRLSGKTLQSALSEKETLQAQLNQHTAYQKSKRELANQVKALDKPINTAREAARESKEKHNADTREALYEAFSSTNLLSSLVRRLFKDKLFPGEEPLQLEDIQKMAEEAKRLNKTYIQMMPQIRESAATCERIASGMRKDVKESNPLIFETAKVLLRAPKDGRKTPLFKEHEAFFSPLV